MTQNKHTFFRYSKCLGSWLHRFNIVEEFDNGVMEVCEICHRKKFFKLIDGKVDNLNYMDWHIRQALPSQHPIYSHEHFYNAYDIETPYL